VQLSGSARFLVSILTVPDVLTRRMGAGSEPLAGWRGRRSDAWGPASQVPVRGHVADPSLYSPWSPERMPAESFAPTGPGGRPRGDRGMMRPSRL
jgi:hypothetical protein